jgi:hypothetical protein
MFYAAAWPRREGRGARLRRGASGAPHSPECRTVNSPSPHACAPRVWTGGKTGRTGKRTGRAVQTWCSGAREGGGGAVGRLRQPGVATPMRGTVLVAARGTAVPMPWILAPRHAGPSTQSLPWACGACCAALTLSSSTSTLGGGGGKALTAAPAQHISLYALCRVYKSGCSVLVVDLHQRTCGAHAASSFMSEAKTGSSTHPRRGRHVHSQPAAARLRSVVNMVTFRHGIMCATNCQTPRRTRRRAGCI